MNNLISGYFSNMFSSQVHAPDENVLAKVRRKVSNLMNYSLMAPYSAEDVRKALFSIGDLKAPGPDGLHAVFYKRFWPMLGEDLIEEVLHAVNNKVMPEGWNDTTIVMIDLRSFCLSVLETHSNRYKRPQTFEWDGPDTFSYLTRLIKFV